MYNFLFAEFCKLRGVYWKNTGHRLKTFGGADIVQEVHMGVTSIASSIKTNYFKILWVLDTGAL